MKLIARPWRPQDLLDDLQEIITEEPESYMNTRRTTLCTALDYLREHFAEQANEPLTKEELLGMDGEPVWVCDSNGADQGCWAFVREGSAVWIAWSPSGIPEYVCRNFSDYGKAWAAYRHKPTQEEPEATSICGCTGIRCAMCQPGACEHRREATT